jgi:hypothetical protein
VSLANTELAFEKRSVSQLTMSLSFKIKKKS